MDESRNDWRWNCNDFNDDTYVVEGILVAVTINL